MKLSSSLRIALVVVVCQMASPLEAETMWAYIGTYTKGQSKGIYAARFDSTSGKFGELQLAAASENPSFLAVHPSKKFLYAVGEVDDYNGASTGFVRAFAVDAQTGQLTELNTQRSEGAAPCHLVVDQIGKSLLVANYTGGSVASIAIQDDGRLGEILSSVQHAGSSVDAARQGEPHAHSINLDAANRYAFAADLGTDTIVVYRFDSQTGRITPLGDGTDVAVPPGSGPRHFAFHPSGNYAYLINELTSTVVAYKYDSTHGVLNSLQIISTLPDGYQASSHTAEIVAHPSGRFVFGSNRGHDSIAVFQVDQDSGQLQRVQIASTGGRTPRNFVVDPSGNYLLAENQGSDSVVVLRIDPASGKLTATGEKLGVPVPVCIRFLRDSQ